MSEAEFCYDEGQYLADKHCKENESKSDVQEARIRRQRAEIRCLLKKNYDLEQSRQFWKSKAEDVGKKLKEYVDKKSCYTTDLEKIAEFYRREAEKNLHLLREAKRWYLAESELPKESGTYLVVGKSKSVHMAHFYKEHTVNGVTYPAHFSSKHVRWWAYRPAPPSEE